MRGTGKSQHPKGMSHPLAQREKKGRSCIGQAPTNNRKKHNRKTATPSLSAENASTEYHTTRLNIQIHNRLQKKKEKSKGWKRVLFFKGAEQGQQEGEGKEKRKRKEKNKEAAGTRKLVSLKQPFSHTTHCNITPNSIPTPCVRLHLQ